MLRIFAIAGILFAISIQSIECKERPDDYLRQMDDLPQGGQDLAIVNNVIGLRLLKQEFNINGDDFFFSPIGLTTSLGILYFMSSGETRSEISRNFLFQNEPVYLENAFRDLLNPIMLKNNMSNHLYVNRGISVNNDFKKLIGRTMDAQVTEIDFSNTRKAVETIKKWASEKTFGQISNSFISGSINHLTKMSLFNTLYFQKEWFFPFEIKSTKLRKFSTFEEEYDIDTMRLQRRVGYLERPEFDCRVLNLPYKKAEQTFVVILPNRYDGESFNVLINKITNNENSKKFYELFVGEVPYRKTKVIIPKLTLKSELQLKEDLKDIFGISKVFDVNVADFSNTVGRNSDQIAISEINQAVFLSMNEQGIMAGGATSPNYETTFRNSDIPAFIADHPFIFAVVDNFTRSILYLGIFTDDYDIDSEER